MKPYYLIRAAGGLLYLSGSVIMAWNVYRTWKQASDVDSESAIPAPDAANARA